MSADQPRSSPHGSRRRDCLLAALGYTLLLTTGCASKEIITQVSLNLATSADANPDANGRASPLTVRLYVLKSSSAFTSADFFSLYDKESATLGADLVQREEALLRPGETKKFDFTLQSDAKIIGVAAAYRDLDRAHWRELCTIPKGKKQCSFNLLFGARQIKIT
jgi:type VI secretion system protein VasD